MQQKDEHTSLHLHKMMAIPIQTVISFPLTNYIISLSYSPIYNNNINKYMYVLITLNIFFAKDLNSE